MKLNQQKVFNLKRRGRKAMKKMNKASETRSTYVKGESQKKRERANKYI